MDDTNLDTCKIENDDNSSSGFIYNLMFAQDPENEEFTFDDALRMYLFEEIDFLTLKGNLNFFDIQLIGGVPQKGEVIYKSQGIDFKARYNDISPLLKEGENEGGKSGPKTGTNPQANPIEGHLQNETLEGGKLPPISGTEVGNKDLVTGVNMNKNMKNRPKGGKSGASESEEVSNIQPEEVIKVDKGTITGEDINSLPPVQKLIPSPLIKAEELPIAQPIFH